MKKNIARILAITVVILGFFLLGNIVNAAETETLASGVVFVKDDINYKFTDYWSETPSERKAPVKEDFVFGGWYQKDTEGNYVPLRETEITDATTSAYAKFVPSYVLSVKAQNQDGTKAGDGNQTSVRLLSAIDSKNYQSVGFHILLNNVITVGTCENISTYESIQAGYGGLEEPITASQAFGAAASYFNVWRLDNINDANDSKIIYARPYWVTKDGTKVEGLAKYVHVEDGYKNYISIPVNLMTGEAVAGGAVDMTYDSDLLDIVSIETGRIFNNIQTDQASKAGTIKMVGYAKTAVDAEGNLINTKADGIYANIRFSEKEGKSADGTHFNMEAKDFCNWDEDLIKTVKAWDITYMGVKQTGMEKEDSKAVSFDFIGGDHVMPIAGYYGPYPYYVHAQEHFPDYITDEMFSLIDGLGINLITYSHTDYSNTNSNTKVGKTTAQLVKDTLKFGEKYGIGIFVKDSAVDGRAGSESISVSELKKQIENYAEYPAFCGMFLVDEPKTSYYMSETDKKCIEDYSKLANVLQYDLNLNCYMNMFPWSRISGGTQEIYKQYVDEFCSTLKPKFLSWDKYPFESADTLDVYFYNMSLMREKSEQYHVPFWAYIQAGGQWTNTTSKALYPNQAQFNWNVNTCLAFGAQGIQYYPLIQPKDHAVINTGWDYDRNGLIGADGETNQWYGYAQSINQHIAAIDEVLMDSVNKGVIVTGEQAETDTAEVNCIIETNAFQELTSVEGNALVGCFNYNGRTALYVVNYDMDSTQNITLNFDATHAIRMTRKATTTKKTEAKEE